jgi:hypothetical protein
MIRRLVLVRAVALLLPGCTVVPADPDNAAKVPLPADVKSLEAGKMMEIRPSLYIHADREGLYAVLGKERTNNPRNWLDLSNTVEVWDGGKQIKLEMLGVRREVEDVHGPVYAVRVTSKDSPLPAIEHKPRAGSFAYNFNSPTSNRDNLTSTKVSTNPLLVVLAGQDTETLG